MMGVLFLYPNDTQIRLSVIMRLKKELYDGASPFETTIFLA